MTPGKTEELVRSVFRAYETKQREVVEAAIAQDFSFTSPYDDAIDRKAYFERCWPNSQTLTTMEVERVVVDDEGGAYVTYMAHSTSGKSFRNTEYMRFRGEQIASVQVFFGESYKGGKFVKQDSK